MLVLIIVVGFILCGYGAIQHYNSEKYAKRKVYGTNVNFFDFMFSNYPIISTAVVVFVILLILATLGVGQ